MHLVVVIPALNEARTLRDLVQQVLALVPDVFVVDDGSDDGTADCIADLSVTVLRHPHRLGKGAALRDGFAVALARGAHAVLTMDADGQHAASDIPRLIDAWRAHPQAIVIGARLIGRERQPASRRRANAVADWFVSWATGQRILDSQSGQRVYPRAALELAGKRRSTGFDFEADMLLESAAHGIRWVMVPIEARYAPTLRPSHFAPVRDIARITRRVSGRIFRGGMLIGNLWRLRRQRAEVVDAAMASGNDAARDQS
jgi:glycosyltransferase involved in cell wall biosynthesis